MARPPSHLSITNALKNYSHLSLLKLSKNLLVGNFACSKCLFVWGICLNEEKCIMALKQQCLDLHFLLVSLAKKIPTVRHIMLLHHWQKDWRDSMHCQKLRFLKAILEAYKRRSSSATQIKGETNETYCQKPKSWLYKLVCYFT